MGRAKEFGGTFGGFDGLCKRRDGAFMWVMKGPHNTVEGVNGP